MQVIRKYLTVLREETISAKQQLLCMSPAGVIIMVRDSTDKKGCFFSSLPLTYSYASDNSHLTKDRNYTVSQKTQIFVHCGAFQALHTEQFYPLKKVNKLG